MTRESKESNTGTNSNPIPIIQVGMYRVCHLSLMPYTTIIHEVAFKVRTILYNVFKV